MHAHVHNVCSGLIKDEEALKTASMYVAFIHGALCAMSSRVPSIWGANPHPSFARYMASV